MKRRRLSTVHAVRFLTFISSVVATWGILTFCLSTNEQKSSVTMELGRSSLPVQTKPTLVLKNRTLVIVMGNLRGGEKAWESLYKNVLDVNSADLALMIGKTNHTGSSMFQRAKNIWEFDEYDDWADAVDLIDGPGWRNSVPKLTYRWSSILGGVKMFRYQGSGAVIFMIRWFLAQEIMRRNITRQYDRFVVTRSDHFYACEHDLSKLNPDSIWIPEGQTYGGVTDRHVVVNAKDLLPVLDILPNVLRKPNWYARLLGLPSGNPEKLIKRRWHDMGLMPRVERFERIMFTCGANGDPTRWRKMSEKMVEEGVYLKYPKEYNASLATCKPGSSAG